MGERAGEGDGAYGIEAAGESEHRERAVKDGSFLSPAWEAVGPGQDPRCVRGYVLEVSASVEGGRLSVYWQYSRNLHLKGTIEGVSGAFREAIDRIIAWCSERGSREKVAGRYPLSGLSEKQLERVLLELHN
jgi:non-ribosomal peptide synthase protein (TIGR01720 family)